jgi:deoxyribonuclease-4
LKLGVHVSIGKGFKGAVDQARALECDGFQIFAGSPRGWARKPLPDSEVSQFKAERGKYGLGPVMVHLSYLPNLATGDPELFEKSFQTLLEDFRRANTLGADFFVFHPGKTKERERGLEKIIAAVNLVLEQIKGSTMLLFENQAGAGGEIAARFQDLGQLLKGVHEVNRAGVCFDTCHAFAAGYDLRSESGWQDTLDEFERLIGLSKLKIFHLNDAMGSLGSHLDRHQHIGQGLIGIQGFGYLINNPRLNQLPGILETPQNQIPEDDLMNLKALRKLERVKN